MRIKFFSKIASNIDAIYRWAKNDYNSWPMRFTLEVIAWALSIGAALTMAITVPTPPLLILYPMWITGCSIYAWTAWTRNSVGMLANYILLVSIDLVALLKIILI
jgi:hypothetical protein